MLELFVEGVGMVMRTPRFISQKALLKSSCKCQFPHKSAHSIFILVVTEDMLTDLCGS